MYEAICFLALGKVFAGFQTGNLVFLGFGVAGTRAPAGPNSVTVVISQPRATSSPAGAQGLPVQQTVR
jgi:hypothetical protein